MVNENGVRHFLVRYGVERFDKTFVWPFIGAKIIATLLDTHREIVVENRSDVLDVVSDVGPSRSLEGVPTVFYEVSESIGEHAMGELSEGLVFAVLLGGLRKPLSEFVASLTYCAGRAEGLLVGFEDCGHPLAVVDRQVKALDLERAPQPRLGPDELPEGANVNSWLIGCLDERAVVDEGACGDADVVEPREGLDHALSLESLQSQGERGVFPRFSAMMLFDFCGFDKL